MKLEKYIEEETKIATTAKKLASEYFSADLEKKIDLTAALTMLVLASLTDNVSLISKAVNLARRKGSR